MSSGPQIKIQVLADAGQAKSELKGVQADVRGVGGASAQAAEQSASLGAAGVQAAGGLGQAAQSAQAAGMSAKQYSAALRGMPAQITDIVTSLQGGQRPLTVLMQQGGQLKDMFGGVVPAARALGGAVLGIVTPLNVALTAMAALGVAAYKGAQEQQRLALALAESGGQAGKTAGQLTDAARSIAAAVGTQGQAVEVLATLVGAGAARAGNDIEGLAKSAIMLDKVGGASIEATTKRIQQMSADPLAGLRKLSDETGRVTLAVYEQAQAYVRAGQNAQAMALVLKQLEAENNRQADALQKNLGYIDRAWMATASGLKGVWDWMKSIGRDDTLEQQIDRLERRIKNFSPALTRQDRIDLDALKETQRLEKRAAAAEAEKAEANRRAVEQADVEQALASATAQHKLAMAALVDEAALKGLKDRLSRSEVMEESAARREAQIQAAGLRRQAQAAREEASRGSDRAASERVMLRAIELEAQAQQALREGERQAEMLLWQRQNGYEQALAGYLMAKIKSTASLNEEVGQLRKQTEAVRTHAVVVDSMATTLEREEASRLGAALAMAKQSLATAQATGVAQQELDVLHQTVRQLQAQKVAQDELVASNSARDDAQASLDQAKRISRLDEETLQLHKQTEAVRTHAVVVDSVATSLERDTAARLAAALATAQQSLASAQATGVAQQELDVLRQTVWQLQARKDAQDALVGSSSARDLAQAGLEQAKRLGVGAAADPFRQWGTGLRDTFATAGDGLARMVDAMGMLAASSKDVSKEMAVIAALRASGEPENIKTAAANERALIKKTQATQVVAYASMASAAKGYFAQTSAGYKTLHAVETALRTYQLAMSAVAMQKDLAAVAAKVGAWVTGESAMTAAAVTGSSVRTAAAAAEGQASAAAGVANQAKGDPYSAFPRMAAMAAMMLALGFSVRGGGGGGTTYDSIASMSSNTGVGSAFGSNEAADSMRKSLEYLRDVAKPELSFSARMVVLLESIDGTLSGSTNALLAGGFNSFGTDFQGSSSGSKGFLGLFGASSESTSLANRGLIFADQSVADALKGIVVSGFETVKTEWSESGFLGIGGGSGTNYSSRTFGVDAQVSQGLTTALAQMVDATQRAAQQMGYAATDAALAQVQALRTGLGKVDLLGKTADEINSTLSAVFSRLGDDVAQVLAPGLQAFQQSGEGYLDTLVRVGSGMEQAQQLTDRLGVQLVALQTIERKTADVAAQAVRQSISVYESIWGTKGVASIVDVLSGSAQDIADAYDGLVQSRSTLASLGLGGDVVTTSLLAGVGGVDALASALDGFQQSFLTEAEKATALQAQTAEKFARAGVALPATVDAFKKMVLSVDVSTQAGQRQLGVLLSLSDAFAAMVDAQESAAQAAQAAADALASSGRSISEWLKGLGVQASMTGGAGVSASRAAYVQTLSLARAGDQDALARITNDADVYLSAAKNAAPTLAQYQAVIAQIRSEVGGLGAVKTYEQSMLDKLDLIYAANVAIETAGLETAQAAAANVAVTGAAAIASEQGANATISMNDQTMVAIAANTASQLNFLAGILSAASASAQSLARIEKTPVSSYSSSGGGGLLGGMIGGVVGGAVGVVNSVVKSIGSILGFAQGDVFAGQGVYTRPTSFNFSGSLAAIGEAGPEGVLPLERMPNGDLGVQALMPPAAFDGDVKLWLQQIASEVRAGAVTSVQAVRAGDERLFDVMLAVQGRLGGLADDAKAQRTLLEQWDADGMPEVRT